MRNGRVIYTEPQGCDIVGNNPWGEAIYIEVKSTNAQSLGFGPGGHVQANQREFLHNRSEDNCEALIAWYHMEKFYFIHIDKIERWMAAHAKMSYPISEARKNNKLP